MNTLRRFAVCITLAFAHDSFAYDIVNHFDLSGAAFKASVLTKPKSLERLGLQAIAKGQRFPATSGSDIPQFSEGSSQCAHGVLLPVELLVSCGAMFEDVPGTRSLNHFYDPAHAGRPLTIGAALGRASPDWALEDNGNVTPQEFSYKAARSNLFLAMSATESLTKRDEYWGKVFQSVGQVVHHLQDMAQPQHVRNDDHFELPVNIPGVTNPSVYT